MRKRVRFRLALEYLAVVLGVIFLSGVVPAADFVLPGEMGLRDQWVREHLRADQPKKPFSFVYNGRDSEGLLNTWPKTVKNEKLDTVRTRNIITWTDAGTGLEIRCLAVEYVDYPAVEWTVYFRNTTARDTPILKNIQGLDTVFHRGQGSEYILNGIKGDWTVAEGYEPYQIALGPSVRKDFTPSNHLGKSSSGPDGWPYFNLQVPGGGVMIAVGWPGQWAASFIRDGLDSLRIQAGQALTHLVLKPGEEIRTPLIAMVFWEGTDLVRAQNLWRRWYIAHNMPRTNGQTQQTITQIQVDGADADISYVKVFLEAGIKPDICWRDAGAGGTTWYPSRNGPYQGPLAWLNTGTWEIDPITYPQGFKPFSDWVHAQGMQFLLWFEPERVGDPNSWLGRNHPEWLLPGEPGTWNWSLDEGNPAAWQWLVDHIDGMIKSQGIDWYREDMNGVGPLPAWHNHDTPDRQGITENLYVQGHLAFWDELRRRNPHLRIDSCASGGRRNDLETMRRAVPLTRSDFQSPDMNGVVEGNQCHTYGLSFWLPFYGGGCYFYDRYSYRSFYMPLFGMGRLTPENTAAQQQAYAECRRIAPCMLGDYYPLTGYSLRLDRWLAWQFNRQDKGDGVIQAFRRSQNQQASQTFRLHGLDPGAEYELIDFDAAGPTRLTGNDLMEKGLIVQIENTPGSAVITYQKSPDSTRYTFSDRRTGQKNKHFTWLGSPLKNKTCTKDIECYFLSQVVDFDSSLRGPFQSAP
ncbi:MAG: Alpha-galactosidase [Planctomycetes bacterium ADurb.Bin412]|nr:MAG: Alpha-galactosidase [Planctomycetes bacterium ADurb.Bin412]